MNFLAHYNSLREKDPYFILGAVMPDIVNDFSKIYNKFIEDKYFPKELMNSSMLKGVENHIKADDVFHKHPLFDEMQNIAKLKMKSIFGDTVRRQFVIAHVLIELMLDQYIMLNDQEILDSFYLKMNEIDINEANRFYIKLNIEENSSHFIRNFTNFRELKFLFHLKENEGVIFTLDKVFSSKLQYDFVAEEQKWNKAIELIKLEVNQFMPIIIEDVKTRLYE
jgi:hypothetical protein